MRKWPILFGAVACLLGAPTASAQEACVVRPPPSCTASPPAVDGQAATRPPSGPRPAEGSPAQAAATALAQAMALQRTALSSTPPNEAGARSARGLFRDLLHRHPDLDSLALGDAGEPWPTVYGVHAAISELSLALGEGERCVREIGSTLSRWPDGQVTRELLARRLLCLDTIDWGAEGRRRGGRRARGSHYGAEPALPQELSSIRQRFIAAGTELLCRWPSYPQATEVRYRIARTYYDNNHFEEAAGHSRAITLSSPTHELAEQAAALYLASLDEMASGWHRGACAQSIAAALPLLSGQYCEPPTVGATELCRVLSQLRCDAIQLEAEGLAADGHHAEAAERYLGIARSHHTDCGRLDEVLYNAGLEYRRAHMSDSAVRVWAILIRNFSESPLAPRARALSAASLHASARYREAADTYALLAREYPALQQADCNLPSDIVAACDAREALRSAIDSYLGLGERELASDAVALYVRNYQRRDREGAANATYASALLLSEREDHEEARTAWREWVQRHAQHASTDRQLGALVWLGREAAALGDAAAAQAHYDAAVARWDGGASVRGHGRSVEATLSRVRASNAAAEAMFRATDRRAARLLASATVSDEELTGLESALAPIAALQIPEWQIAAAGRIAEVAAHAAEARRGEARTQMRALAVTRAEHCHATALAVRWYSAEAVACRRLLEQLAPDTHPAFDELVARTPFTHPAGAPPPVAEWSEPPPTE